MDREIELKQKIQALLGIDRKNLESSKGGEK